MDVDEFELLLSIDGGRTFPLRLTGMLDPCSTSYAWRVPNLPTAAACLRMRAGEEREEVLLRSGPLFELAGDTRATTGKFTFQSGEWWPTESVAIAPREVEVGPSISEPEPPEDVRLTAVTVPSQRANTRLVETAIPIGGTGARTLRASAADTPREDPAAATYPQPE